ncbi:ABC transporter substrate-binding protein [Rhizosaccharibacter radicis]|uniref:ABC transporter substrate-binding protein n=1 Tax=Rhizosaccharibacter radicis TaxID=2782605 RepID=A0ABT1W0A4_9PROT|nr:ABC transporter substrate-binding protein [Acetobacteraceae bacterium KSS12]
MNRFRPILRALPVLAALLPAPAVANDKLTLLLDWFVNSNHEAILTAEANGDFARHGLDVTLIAPADPSSPPRLLAAHQADLCVSYQPSLGSLVEGGLPVRRVGTLLDTPLNEMLVLADGPIRSLKDLKGRHIGMEVGAANEAALGVMLAEAGLKRSDVQVTEIGMQIETALMSHSVDAVLGAMRNYEQIDLQQRGVKVRAFLPEEHGEPLYDELILLARADEVSDPRIPRFLDALADATNTLLNHPEEMWAKAIAKRPDLDTPLNHAAWMATLPRLAKTPALLDRKRYESFQRFMKAQGQQDAVLRVEKITAEE